MNSPRTSAIERGAEEASRCDCASARPLGFIAATARPAGVAATGFSVITTTGPDAGQEIDHLHWHVIGGTCLGGMV